jgi:hypothetical protein
VLHSEVSRFAAVRLLVRSSVEALCYSRYVMCRCIEVSGKERRGMRLGATVRCVTGLCIEATFEERTGMRLCAAAVVSSVAALRLVMRNVFG